MSLLLEHGRHRGNATREDPPPDPEPLDFYIHTGTRDIIFYKPIEWGPLDLLAFAAAGQTPPEGEWVLFGRMGGAGT